MHADNAVITAFTMLPMLQQQSTFFAFPDAVTSVLDDFFRTADPVDLTDAVLLLRLISSAEGLRVSAGFDGLVLDGVTTSVNEYWCP